MSKTKKKGFIELGIQFGLLHEGWNLKDYLIHAVDNEDGYETALLHGVQGSGKSTRALQICAWVKHHTLTKELGREPTERELWLTVLDSVIFKPSEFVSTLEAVPDDAPLDVLIWDDIQAHYTSSTFKTDIQAYSAIDSTWAVIRTKVHVILITIPNITRLAKNVKDNITFEIFIGKNRVEQIRRLFRLPGTKYVDSNLFKPQIGLAHKFDLYKMPKWAWDLYYKKRLELANEALQTLRAVTNMEKLDGFIPITEAVKICKANGVNWGVSTLQQGCSRGIFRGQKINGQLCIQEESLMSVLEVERLEVINRT